jgi:TM2 domain-containing membrane protein YozV
MDADKADMYIMTNAKYFEGHHLPMIRERLLKVDPSKASVLMATQLTDPTLSLIVSILVGSLGVDRFIIGDTGLGVAKLLTCGGLGVWYIVDWFLIMPATREKNLLKLNQFM